MNQVLFKQGRFTEEDIRQVISIHRREIAQGFLSSLNDQALGLLYSHISDSEVGALIAAKDKATGRACGFVCGTSDMAMFYRDFLLKKSWRAAIYLAPQLLSPSRLWRILEVLLYPAKKQKTKMPSAELLVIAVDEQYQGSGVAASLFRELVEALRDQDVQDFKIVVGENLIRAQRFYEKQGAHKVTSTQVHKGQNSLVYIYKIDQIQHRQHQGVPG
jgi:ribosomal protein S18 acetylase RimI-like enzyme